MCWTVPVGVLEQGSDVPIFDDSLASYGQTPLIRINRLTAGRGGTILAKIEGRNPAFSVKCRIGAAMILDAEQRGVLSPGMQVVEATSGNTGIALAHVCAVRGYRLTLTMPEIMSQERRIMLQGYGAELVLTSALDGMQGAIRKAEEIASQSGWFMPRQFDNPANPRIHMETTGPEIWKDAEGQVDALVLGVGTGGTITGVGRYLRDVQKSKARIFAVEPASSPVLSGGCSGRHGIQGIGAGFVPSILDRSLIDEVLLVTDEEAITMARRLMREEGIAAGISSGAALHAALMIAARPDFAGKTIVTLFPDAAERYLTSPLFEDLHSADRSPRISIAMEDAI